MIELKESCDECRYIDIIGNIGKEILTQLDFDKILYSCYEQINTIVDAPLFAIGIHNSENNELQFYGLKNQFDSIITGDLSLNDSQIWSVRSFTNSEEIIINEYTDSQNMYFSKILFSEEDAKRKSFLYVPLIYKSKTIGVLSLQSFHANAFNTQQINIIKIIANYMSIAIENTNYVNEINVQKNHLSTVIENMEEIISARTFEIEQQKKQLEEQSETLHKSNEELTFLSIVAKETENAIMIMDSFGHVLWINDYFTRIYGYTFNSFLKIRGSNIRQTSFNPEIDTILTKCITTKKAVTYSAYNIRENGDGIWTQTSLTPIIDEFGNIINLVTIDSDITNIKNAEELIKEKSNEILQSIEYASRIQRAAFPSLKSINEILPNNFIFWKPLDILSGDFYWLKRKGNYTVIVMGDCTGHGVPAALLSMLGCSFMEDIINNYIDENAGEIIDRLQVLFDQRFRHWVMGAGLYDGMDVAVCVINNEMQTLDFAGANQDLLIIENEDFLQISGNRRSIGKQPNDENITFTNHTLTNCNEKLFYLFSDGFSSQFGGELGKKYLKKRFVNFIHSISNKSFAEQNIELKIELENWLGKDYPQIDDVLVMGFQPTILV